MSDVGEFTGVKVGTENELATTGAAAEKQYEIQSAIIIARKFPRNEEQCFQSLMKACSRQSFAEDARYSFPRADVEVTGPSVNLAREAARVWGNIRYGLYIVRDDAQSRLIRAWAWDIQTNTKVELEDDFQKLIQRKGKGWITPDERDLRELTNRRGAILLRNALLQVMPKDLIEDALYACDKAMQQTATVDPEAVRKRLIMDFGTINVTVEQLERKLGHPLAQSTPKEMAELRAIYKSIADGNSRWSEYETAEEPSVDKSKVEDVREKMKAMQSSPPPSSEPPKGTQAQSTSSPSIDWNDVAWKKFIAYMGDDPERFEVLRWVRDKLKVRSAASLAGSAREGFAQAVITEAHVRKVKLVLGF